MRSSNLIHLVIIEKFIAQNNESEERMDKIYKNYYNMYKRIAN